MNRLLPLLSLLLVFSLGTLAQTENELQQQVTVRGQVVDAENGNPLLTMMVVSKNKGSGTFGNAEAKFILPLDRDDVLLVGAVGYETVSFKLPADFKGNNFSKVFELNKLVIELPLIEVISERELEEIQKDIDALGYDRQDYMLSGVSAVSSPVTFLYQAFSKRERSKRLVAEMRNEDRKRELLKELFSKYVDYDIIDLENDRFDEFVDFCNVSDHFMQSSSQYDFLVHIKQRFKEYENSPQWLRNRGSDTEYYRE